MSKFVQNPIHFAADCVHDNGLCPVVRENFIFLNDGKEHMAIDHLQRKCGEVVIIPDTSNKEQAWLYHTSCERMTDVANQIFQDHLKSPASVPQPDAEMMVGELHRQSVTMSYDDCRAKVEGFSF